MRSEGKDVISFAAGEPDFNTPEEIRDAAKQALDEGLTKYTSARGMTALREAIVAKLERENHIAADLDMITVSCGAKQCLYNALMALVGPGDEVIVFAPYWPTYVDQVRLCGAIPVVVHTNAESGFRPNIEQIKTALTSNTKAIIINSPNNPTGAVWDRQLIKDIAALALRNNLWILSDEIYERLIYDGEHQSVAALSKEVAASTVTILGCSKSFAMTGWRIGFACAQPELTSQMANIQDQVTSNAVSFAQAGAIHALGMDRSVVDDMREIFRGRRESLFDALSKIEKLQVHKSEGAFYLFPKLVGDNTNCEEVASQLLTEKAVAVVPGVAFGAPGYLRLSYATDSKSIAEGSSRMQDYFAR